MVDWVATSTLWANWATAAGFMAGACTAWFALLSYRGQLRMQADAHAHGLIRDLLRVNMDPQLGVGREASTFRLYTLEELVDWVHEQQRDLQAWGWLEPRERANRKDELDRWFETLKTHLEPGTRARIAPYSDCYGERFRDFVERYGS
jgi:predicted TIM-barrel fold metal-dependent hydrolase